MNDIESVLDECLDGVARRIKRSKRWVIDGEDFDTVLHLQGSRYGARSFLNIFLLIPGSVEPEPDVTSRVDAWLPEAGFDDILWEDNPTLRQDLRNAVEGKLIPLIKNFSTAFFRSDEGRELLDNAFVSKKAREVFHYVS